MARRDTPPEPTPAAAEPPPPPPPVVEKPAPRAAPPPPQPAAKKPTGKGGKADGKSIFASAGCATCHTLAAAGATGTVGPNLDQAKPSLDLAIERVTNGKGVMPSFKGQLTEAEIRAVAEFASTSSRQ